MNFKLVKFRLKIDFEKQAEGLGKYKYIKYGWGVFQIRSDYFGRPCLWKCLTDTIIIQLTNRSDIEMHPFISNPWRILGYWESKRGERLRRKAKKIFC